MPILAVSTVWILSLGFLLGLRHATEADHLAAVSTIVADRKSLFGAAVIGGLWGLGHTISLVLAGIFVLYLNFQINEQTEHILEFSVGVMLVLLGLNVLRKIIAGRQLHFHAHTHGQIRHAHPHLHKENEADEKNSHHGLSFSPRAVIIGMIHGLAGSAALMLLVIPTIESKLTGLLYIVIFGVGSIAGMMLMSFLVGLPFRLTAAKFDKFNFALQCVAGLLSLAIGIKVIYENISF